MFCCVPSKSFHVPYLEHACRGFAIPHALEYVLNSLSSMLINNNFYCNVNKNHLDLSKLTGQIYIKQQ